MAEPLREPAARQTLKYAPGKRLPVRRGVAWWAFLLHRVSGLALAAYLAFHLLFLSNLHRGPEAYEAFLATVSGPVVVWLEILLVAGAIFHGFNGVRLTAVGLGYGARRQLLWFWLAFALGLVALVAMALRMLAAGE